MGQNKKPRIAIVGGGPAGLTLARVLATRGVPSTVFERDLASDYRPQGGTLDLHPESGWLAVRRAGLEREFAAVARPEDQGMRLYDETGNLRFDDQSSDGDRPEVDRTALRRLLLDSLEPGCVRWGCRLSRVEPLDDGRMDVLLDEGSREAFDLVVGADGPWSKVRLLLSEATPEYSGVAFYEFGLDDVDARHPSLAKLVGRGSMFALGDNRALIAQRNGNSHLRVYAAIRVAEEEVRSRVDISTTQAARESLLNQFVGWDESLLELVEEGQGFRAWPLYALPVGHAWRPHLGATLIGDAAHLMSPFSGQGANLAMLDASDLALAISDDDDWNEAVWAFEARMVDRARGAAQAAARGLAEAIAPSPGAVEHAAEWMNRSRERAGVDPGASFPRPPVSRSSRSVTTDAPTSPWN